MEKKEKYVSPEEEILEVSVEKGFQASVDGPNTGDSDGGNSGW